MSTDIPEVRRGKPSWATSNSAPTTEAAPDMKKLTVEYLTKSIAGVADAGDRLQLKELQDKFMSDGDYTDIERQLINWLIGEVKKGGDLQMLLSGETMDLTSSRVEDTSNDEQFETQRQTRAVLLDALTSGKCDFKDLKPIIEEFRRMSTDGDGFTQDEARSIQIMVNNLA